MGIGDGYLKAVKSAMTMLTYPPGWSEENQTGSWRDMRPVLDREKCKGCGLCWLYCPESVISRVDSYAIDYIYCKGCGICAVECKFGAITMRSEEKA